MRDLKGIARDGLASEAGMFMDGMDVGLEFPWNPAWRRI
jgi:hypothetical protein